MTRVAPEQSDPNDELVSHWAVQDARNSRVLWVVEIRRYRLLPTRRAPQYGVVTVGPMILDQEDGTTFSVVDPPPQERLPLLLTDGQPLRLARLKHAQEAALAQVLLRGGRYLEGHKTVATDAIIPCNLGWWVTDVGDYADWPEPLRLDDQVYPRA